VGSTKEFRPESYRLQAKYLINGGALGFFLSARKPVWFHPRSS